MARMVAEHELATRNTVAEIARLKMDLKAAEAAALTSAEDIVAEVEARRKAELDSIAMETERLQARYSRSAATRKLMCNTTVTRNRTQVRCQRLAKPRRSACHAPRAAARPQAEFMAKRASELALAEARHRAEMDAVAAKKERLRVRPALLA